MSRTKINSRATYYGIKATALARDTKKKLSSIRAKIDKLQEPWAEADPMIETATRNALQALDELVKQYEESAEYLNEAIET